MKPEKVYLGITEGDFKQLLKNHKKSFNNITYRNDAALSKYVWEKYSETTVLKWNILRTVTSNLNITKRCLLCFHEKSEIL